MKQRRMRSYFKKYSGIQYDMILYNKYWNYIMRSIVYVTWSFNIFDDYNLTK